jgi:hypothetical protein
MRHPYPLQIFFCSIAAIVSFTTFYCVATQAASSTVSPQIKEARDIVLFSLYAEVVALDPFR